MLITFERKIKFSFCFHQMNVESSNLVYLLGFWGPCLKTELFDVAKLYI